MSKRDDDIRAQMNALVDGLLDGHDDLVELPPKTRAPSQRASDHRAERYAQIIGFIEEHGREPSKEAKGLEEKLLASSLDGMRQQPTAELIAIDTRGLLQGQPSEDQAITLDDLIDDPLFSNPLTAPTTIPEELARFEERGARRVAEEIAERRPVIAFASWRPIFDLIRAEINDGRRRTSRTNATSRINEGDVFIVEGHLHLVARVREEIDETGQRRQRVRVIIDNATEYEPYLESFGKALWRDEHARVVSRPDGSMASDGLFGNQTDQNSPDNALATPPAQVSQPAPSSGCVYVARTLGAKPDGLARRIIKIGRTTGEPERRIAGAAEDETFLRQPATLVDVYRLTGVSPVDLERALHAFFAAAHIPMSIVDGYGKERNIREWFELDPELVAQAVNLINERRLSEHRYDKAAQRIVSK